MFIFRTSVLKARVIILLVDLFPFEWKTHRTAWQMSFLTGSSGNPRWHKWDRTAATSPSTPVSRTSAGFFRVQVPPPPPPALLRGNEAVKKGALGNPPLWLSLLQLCDLIFHECLINPRHGQGGPPLLLSSPCRIFQPPHANPRPPNKAGRWWGVGGGDSGPV